MSEAIHYAISALEDERTVMDQKIAAVRDAVPQSSCELVRRTLPREPALMTADAMHELERLAQAAHEQGRVKIEAVCRLAQARIEELSAEIARLHGNARLGAQTRLQRLTSTQRSLIASAAAKRRWERHRRDAHG